MNQADIDEDAIRAKAYELWQLRGSPQGDAGEDWALAERLLRVEATDSEVTLPMGMPVPELEERGPELEVAKASVHRLDSSVDGASSGGRRRAKKRR